MAMKPHFEFRPEDHTYWLDGERLPGVSEIIDKSGINGWASNAAKRTRGTLMHELTALYDTTGKVNVPIELEDLFTSWLVFVERYDVQFFAIEQQIYSARFRFAGTIDRVMCIEGKPARICGDIKTGVVTPRTALQLGAYSLAWNEHNPDAPCTELLAVHLNESGKLPRLERYALEESQATFLAALRLVRWREKHNI